MKKRRKLVSATEKTTLKGKILRLVTSHECNIGDNKVRISEKQCQLYLAVNSNNIEYLFKHIVSKPKYNTCSMIFTGRAISFKSTLCLSLLYFYSSPV